MKSQVVTRTLTFRIKWDDSTEGAKAEVVKRLNQMVKDRSYPIPFSCSGSSASFGSFEIERLIR